MRDARAHAAAVLEERIRARERTSAPPRSRAFSVEMAKKTRHKPLRKLLQRSRNLPSSGWKPCSS